MKTLILVRHGKSSWEYSVDDKDRPLKERGIDDGHLVSAELRSQDLSIDAVFSSPANRALHTCLIFLRQLNFPFINFEVTNDLYDFSGESVLKFIQKLDDRFDTVMIFGHNEAFTNVANTLGDSQIEKVPTTGLVQLDFEVNNWSSVTTGKTAQTLFPKKLK
ncbi:histidine phosphatase family protein [Pricia sp. S334]|uniref:Histidine phosphatase family protein n=1 Tax=Pricia mediterranea TaxID=3076079 RepID=A0ABU3L2H9_9FLAO|nr:histidine phosphatase family protein [Pricia sp. S334]MDT7827307.1 histidine phosphatase family protein [Pricia sp. S334]